MHASLISTLLISNFILGGTDLSLDAETAQDTVTLIGDPRTAREVDFEDLPKFWMNWIVLSDVSSEFKTTTTALAQAALDVAEQAKLDNDKELFQSAIRGARNLLYMLKFPDREPPGGALAAVHKTHHPAMYMHIGKLDAADIATDLTPGISMAKDIAIITTGINPVTGEIASPLDISIRIACLIVPSFAGAAVKKYSSVAFVLTKRSIVPEVSQSLRKMATSFGQAEKNISRWFGHHLLIPCTP